jgi:hypothetical protein
MFEGYSDTTPPSLFILIGNFTSKPFVYSSSGIEELKGI